MTEERDPKSSARKTVQTPLEISRSLPGDPGAVDSPDLMGYPFFSLGESRRLVPIRYQSLGVTIKVEGTSGQGIATIWDADILIWAASQIFKARNEHTGTSRLLEATPAQILQFIGRGHSIEDHDRLRSALDRLQSTSISTSLRQLEGRRQHRFSWIGEWKEHASSKGWSARISFLLPDWLYLGLLDGTVRLAFDPVYFALKGGLARWLYRIIRHSEPHFGGLELMHLYGRSGILAWPADFARHVRRLATEQSLPGYELGVIRGPAGQEILTFAPRECGTPSKPMPAPPTPIDDQESGPG
jgi:plasmid replication initiation protein